ncbi:Mab-21 domain-containing protein [Aphis craccivora]|uniref:Mab-21 domain-containing protein n=1 Tax=Aphis craccivora TaxID=307492 RepID=A0A6G0YQF7_APHCR|nr:Mab-21 domain-containing protein [Aphis craccivora]
MNDLPTSSSSLNVEAIVNRIIQRLLCGIGKLDKRFACKFLVTAEPMSSSIKLFKSFSYYIRLDVLSEPKIYEDDFDYQVRCIVEEDGVPQGFAKIRLVTNEPQKWADLIDNDGYLRRMYRLFLCNYSDKLKLRFVELLAKSASYKSDFVGRPEDVDESYLCGCPGKIVDAGLLHEILKSPADEQVFFGMGNTGSSKFPDPRDLRIAVVEDAQCVKLRISGPKTSGDIAVVLLPAIEFSGWPKYTDILSRIPLTHPDILIHQRATTTGYYAVPVAPHLTVRCYDRPATWQLRFPAAECLYQTHYSERSVVSNIYHFLRTKVPKLRKGDNGVCVASGYMLKTLLWFRLESCGRVEDWDHRRVAEHVLSVLDELVAALKSQHHRSYFYPYANIVLNAPRACRTMVSEDDYQNDVEVVEAYMYGLFEKSMGSDSIVTGQAFQNTDADYWQNLESVMLHKWYRVLETMDPKPRRFDYSRKQVEYIGEVFKGMLATRHCVSIIRRLLNKYIVTSRIPNRLTASGILQLHLYAHSGAVSKAKRLTAIALTIAY